MEEIGNSAAATPKPERRLSAAAARKEGWKKLIVDLYMKGHSQKDCARIAEEKTGHPFGNTAVTNYINEAIGYWQESRQSMIENHKAIELEKINRLELAYWEGWERSCLMVKSKSKIKRKEEDSKKMALHEVRDDEKPSQGDPRFLNGIQWCVDKRCTILGIEVPQMPATLVQVNNNNTGTSTTIVRRVVFRTRETVSAPQIIAND